MARVGMGANQFDGAVGNNFSFLPCTFHVDQRPQEKRYVVCHRQGRPDPGGLPQTEHPLPEKMGGHSPLEQEDGRGSAGDGLPTWEGCLSHHDPPMFRILAVAYPELDGRLRASQQPQEGGGAVASKHEGAASHLALEGETTDSEFTSGTEGEGSSTAGTGADTSDTDSSSDGSSLVVVATYVPPASTVVPVVTGIWSAPATRAASVARSHSTDSPPPVKHQKLASARQERGKTPATKAAPRGPGGSVESAVTPSKVRKGHKKPGKSGKSSTAGRPPSSPMPRSPPPAQAQLPRTGPPALAHLPRRPPLAPAHLPRRSPLAPAHLPRRPAPAHLPRRLPPSQAPLGHEGPPAQALLGHEGPPAKAPLGHEALPAAETLQWRPPSQAPLNRAPPTQAPLSRAPPSQAPLHRALPSQALLHRAPPSQAR
ncbi:hypothetical protein NDU88_005820 [Pleurodeles waltl]|uniref:Nascent polypeptide-associated complex subunit alpha, muscle-specific form-like n=1 Tax=Pleurodeles waltl TaxID=8319 RepID=A0AAV7VNQ7_PLEWA|nr:hypothetical protein NDU88_005820 [Pleurodeles waltl]